LAAGRGRCRATSPAGGVACWSSPSGIGPVPVKASAGHRRVGRGRARESAPGEEAARRGASTGTSSGAARWEESPRDGLPPPHVARKA
jgi:hypothetical protein